MILLLVLDSVCMSLCLRHHFFHVLEFCIQFFKSARIMSYVMMFRLLDLFFVDVFGGMASGSCLSPLLMTFVTLYL